MECGSSVEIHGCIIVISENGRPTILQIPIWVESKSFNKHSLTDITEQTRNACDKGLYTCSIYLDLQKAFDTVNQNILLAKLKHGIEGTSLDWFKSLLYVIGFNTLQ